MAVTTIAPAITSFKVERSETSEREARQLSDELSQRYEALVQQRASAASTKKP